jgi:hypothetical protein
VYAATVREQRLVFTVSGMLWNRSLVMQDVQTGSLWSHILGEAMDGPLKGAQLDALPGVLTDWKTWKAEHPGTTVLALSRTAKEFDAEFQQRPQTFVVGVVIRGKAKAYPFDVLLSVPVVNDTFEGVPLLVLFNKESTAARVFRRDPDDDPLTFEVGDGNPMRDAETGSVWNAASGECVSGKLKGRTLRPLPGIVSFRKAWQQFHPDSVYYTGP